MSERDPYDTAACPSKCPARGPLTQTGTSLPASGSGTVVTNTNTEMIAIICTKANKAAVVTWLKLHWINSGNWYRLMLLGFPSISTPSSVDIHRHLSYVCYDTRCTTDCVPMIRPIHDDCRRYMVGRTLGCTYATDVWHLMCTFWQSSPNTSIVFCQKWNTKSIFYRMFYQCTVKWH